MLTVKLVTISFTGMQLDITFHAPPLEEDIEYLENFFHAEHKEAYVTYSYKDEEYCELLTGLSGNTISTSSARFRYKLRE